MLFRSRMYPLTFTSEKEAEADGGIAAIVRFSDGPQYAHWPLFPLYCSVASSDLRVCLYTCSHVFRATSAAQPTLSFLRLHPAHAPRISQSPSLLLRWCEPVHLTAVHGTSLALSGSHLSCPALRGSCCPPASPLLHYRCFPPLARRPRVCHRRHHCGLPGLRSERRPAQLTARARVCARLRTLASGPCRGVVGCVRTRTCTVAEPGPRIGPVTKLARCRMLGARLCARVGGRGRS